MALSSWLLMHVVVETSMKKSSEFALLGKIDLVEDDSIDSVKKMLSLALEGDSGIYLLNLILITYFFIVCVEIICMLSVN